jgi:hypothetical protein
MGKSPVHIATVRAAGKTDPEFFIPANSAAETELWPAGAVKGLAV